MLNDSLLKDLAKATSAWLSFNSLCGLEGLLSESALNIPVGTFIGTKSSARIVSQFRHPYFNSVDGRPKQIDFALKNSKGKVAQAIECKWSNVSVQAVINDIYRLECLGTKALKVDPFAKGLSIGRFFLIAGNIAAMEAFAAKGVNVGGARVRIRDFLLSFDDDAPKKRFNVQTAAPNVQELVRRFQGAYYPKSPASIPKIIVTELVGNASDGPFRVHIWKVNRAQGTGTLKLPKADPAIPLDADWEE
jgi:hypothetical protein